MIEVDIPTMELINAVAIPPKIGIRLSNIMSTFMLLSTSMLLSTVLVVKSALKPLSANPKVKPIKVPSTPIPRSKEGKIFQYRRSRISVNRRSSLKKTDEPLVAINFRSPFCSISCISFSKSFHADVMGTMASSGVSSVSS